MALRRAAKYSVDSAGGVESRATEASDVQQREPQDGRSDEHLGIEMSSLPAHEGDVTNTVPNPGLGVNLQAEEGAGEPKLLNCLPSRPPFRTFDSRTSTTQALEDEITILEDVDIDVVIPSKLSALDFPKAEDGHEEDVAKVIRKSFSKLGVERHAQSDPLAVLAHGALSLHLSWQAQVEAAVQHQDDDFWQRVAQKTQTLNIGRIEAIFEVYTDLVVEQAGSEDVAILWVLRQDFKEFCTELFVIRLLERGASVTSSGQDGNTVLHLAAIKGFSNVARKLLEKGAPAMGRNRRGQTPLELAVEAGHNEFARLMVKTIEPARVRQLCQSSGLASCKLSLHTLLEQPAMEGTVLAVLDTLIEPLVEQPDTFLIHYSILDSDPQGRAPPDPQFDKSTKSCLHKIAKSGNKAVVYHDVVRLLLRHKWKKFARYVFLWFSTHRAVIWEAENVMLVLVRGYLEQTVATAIINALSAVGSVKPKYPFLSSTKSALLYTAYHLKAYNPKSSSYTRNKFKKKLAQFEEQCRLIAFLGASMRQGYKEPRERPIDFQHKMVSFLKLRQPGMITS